jgi:NADH-quinone oxidoreductase subunit C
VVAEIEISGDEWRERARALKDEGWLLGGLCGLDRLHLGFDKRFGIVVQLLHRERKERQMIHVAASGEPPTIPSVTDLWAGANFMEREAYDMFGIHFEGHPRLTRILMPDEWEGYPLRKDYGVGKVPVDFVRQPFLQVQGPGQSPSPERAQVEPDRLGQSPRLLEPSGTHIPVEAEGGEE